MMMSSRFTEVPPFYSVLRPAALVPPSPISLKLPLHIKNHPGEGPPQRGTVTRFSEAERSGRLHLLLSASSGTEARDGERAGAGAGARAGAGAESGVGAESRAESAAGAGTGADSGAGVGTLTWASSSSWGGSSSSAIFSIATASVPGVAEGTRDGARELTLMPTGLDPGQGKQI